MKRLSFRLRLWLAGGLAIVLALGFAGWQLSVIFARHIERSALRDLSNQFESLALSVTTSAGGTIALRRPPLDPLYDQPYSGHYWQVQVGQDKLLSRSLWDLDLPLPPAAFGTGSLAGPQGQNLLVVDRLITQTGDPLAPPMRVTVAIDRQQLDLAEAAFLADLAPYLSFLAIILIAAGALQITVGLRPFAVLGRRLNDLQTGRLARIGDDDLPSEVRPLARQIDQLLAAREAERDRGRQRAGDLAHGLKTPLQALLGEAGQLARAGQTEAAAAIEETVRQMQAHVDRELTRTRLASASNAPCDAVAVAHSVVSVLRRTPDGGARTWSIVGANRLMVRLDKADLAEAVGALAENAARFARQQVEIRLTATKGRAQIVVHDDGKGIQSDDPAQLIDRGLKLDQRPGGTGLGLAIVAEIAAASGGELVLHNTPDGFEAHLLLPLAAAT